jgi:uncharacterized protein
VMRSLKMHLAVHRLMDTSVTERIARLDWARIRADLDERGYATTEPLLTPSECADIVALYDQRERFRSRIVMERFRFGVGEYKYFAAPLPPIVEGMRVALYPRIARVANEWTKAMGGRTPFPPTLDDFLEICHRAGQTKPTPLLLRYDAGGYNCMHQDIYGEVVFPIQVTCVLSRRDKDYQGGEFVLMEQRPRAQSRCEAVTLEQGEAIIFTTRYRPVRGTRGYYRVNVRHGVSRLHSGRRFSLGIIFHDAK